MKYAIGVVGLIIIAVIAVLAIVFRSDTPNPTDPDRSGNKAVKIEDYVKKNATVIYTRQGELVGESERRAVRISVTPSFRTIEILEGYDQRVISTQTFSNTQAGYETFLMGLANAGYAAQREYEPKDERGVCPLGNRFIFQLKEADQQPLYTWATTCSEKQGTFAGNASLVRRLFEQQIPEYREAVAGTRL